MDELIGCLPWLGGIVMVGPLGRVLLPGVLPTTATPSFDGFRNAVPAPADEATVAALRQASDISAPTQDLIGVRCCISALVGARFRQLSGGVTARGKGNVDASFWTVDPPQN